MEDKRIQKQAYKQIKESQIKYELAKKSKRVLLSLDTYSALCGFLMASANGLYKHRLSVYPWHKSVANHSKSLYLLGFQVLKEELARNKP